MNWNELKAWVLRTQIPDKQVEMYIRDEGEKEYLVEGVGAFNAPFMGYTCKGEWTGGQKSSKLHVNLWDDEYFQKYTWQNLLDWIETLENKDEEAIVLCAYHALSIKVVNAPIQWGRWVVCKDCLYAYKVEL